MASFNLPPRQKMINLIYVVLLAMMAINVSSDVMQGFTVLALNSQEQNRTLREMNERLTALCRQSGIDGLPAKADSIARATQALCTRTDSLRERITRWADKDDYQPGRLVKAEDMKAVPYIMLAPTQNNGKKLRRDIEALRALLLRQLDDSTSRKVVAGFLSTQSKSRYSWEKDNFSTLPAIGGIILLNKIEENVLLASNQTLRELLGMADTAPVQPAPEPEDDEPQQASVTLFPKQMNFLYAGISNPLEIFDGGHADASLQLSTDNGRIARTQSGWTLSGAHSGQATVTIKAGGQTVGTRRFTVRELPEPTAAISYTAGGRRHSYSGRTPVSKDHLTANPQLTAAYAGDFIDVNFRVVRFHTIFINADKSVTTLEARGNRFTRQQIQKIQQLRRGEKFYVSSIVVSAPDGREREIEPIEALVI